MAEKATKTAEPKLTQAPGNEVLARRMQAVKAAGHLTPKMQRGFDRLAASLAKR